MTYTNFRNMSKNEKAAYLWKTGKPVARSVKDDATFILYEVDAFYVEVEYQTDFIEMVNLTAYEAHQVPEKYSGRRNV